MLIEVCKFYFGSMFAIKKKRKLPKRLLVMD
ncbi:hypothetical protein AusDCA_4327 [Desulfitobacterium sp. AusDCA]